MQVAQVTEDRALNAHLARADRFTELAELSFKDLLELEDELSEGGQWSLLDDVRSELEERRDGANDALHALFLVQCTTNGVLPMGVSGKVENWAAAVYLTESFGDAKWGAMVSHVLLGLTARESLLLAMADEYASEQAESLLKAEWVPQ